MTDAKRFKSIQGKGYHCVPPTSKRPYWSIHDEWGLISQEGALIGRGPTLRLAVDDAENFSTIRNAQIRTGRLSKEG